MKYKKIFIGIDPGRTGGIAAITQSRKVVVCERLPADGDDLYDLLEDLKHSASEVYCMLEKVHSSPQMGVVSAFSFGQSFGGTKAVLQAMRVPFSLATPQAWQKYLACMTGGDKNVTKIAAKEMFPDQNVTHAVADALLIAEYCRKTFDMDRL